MYIKCINETHLWQPHKGPLKDGDKRFPLFPANDPVESPLPLLEIPTLLLQCILHLRKLFLATRFLF